MVNSFFTYIVSSVGLILSVFNLFVPQTVHQDMKDFIWRCLRKRWLSEIEKRAQDVLDEYTATTTEQSNFVLRCPENIKLDPHDGYLDHAAKGTIYIQRPNLARLDIYDFGHGYLKIFSDGHSIVRTNRVFREELLEFKYFPLHFFCRGKIDVIDYSGVQVNDKNPDNIIIDLVEKDGAKLKLTFNKDYVLTRFMKSHINKNEDISYEFSNTQKNVEFKEDTFERPEREYHQER